MQKNIVLITPPFVQLSSPYPATAFLKGALAQENFCVKQYDFSILLALKLFSKDGLSELFEYGYSNNNDIKIMLQTSVDYFYSNNEHSVGQGFYHMIPNPKNGGAMKRMLMYLRWMVRKSDVDLGIWNFIKPKDLLIPLDVHVSRVSRNMGLLKRKSNDYLAVLELTESLRKYCPNDPIKYDFAMFGYGIEQ